MVKKEVAFLGLVCQIYTEFTAISDCETRVHDFMARHKSQVVFSPRFLQDFAIYINQGHF